MNDGKVPDGFTNPIVTGVLAFVMSIVTMMKVTKNMPKTLTDGNIYSSPTYCVDNGTQKHSDMHQLPPPKVSNADYFVALKRMAALEEKMRVLSMRPALSAEKENMLNAALNKVDTLEQELSEAKKVTLMSHDRCLSLLLLGSGNN